DDLDEIAPRGRLAAGKVYVQHAEPRGLRKNAPPILRAKLGGARIERKRVRAIGAAERTDVGELGEQTNRRLKRGFARLAQNSTIPLAARSASSERTSPSIRTRSPLYVAQRSSTISFNVRAPSQRLSTATATGSARITRSGASRTWPPRASSLRSRTPR